ncbi:hypothetical protein SISNIDRAFT_470498 [Sistotremastrum niveocremeum HHB9708]|uniref:Uncharacterized protein n=1 Tax=Sistotremastrum niveocremeum HHB9708 TaxID=1314777 RepID=A0A164NTN9_9AGAM|nr:hypothetical protein SISNIDRAFT_470498 [Sistotremastrum niveocremeum HHB9708]
MLAHDSEAIHQRVVLWDVREAGHLRGLPSTFGAVGWMWLLGRHHPSHIPKLRGWPLHFYRSLERVSNKMFFYWRRSTPAYDFLCMLFWSPAALIPTGILGASHFRASCENESLDRSLVLRDYTAALSRIAFGVFAADSPGNPISSSSIIAAAGLAPKCGDFVSTLLPLAEKTLTLELLLDRCEQSFTREGEKNHQLPEGKILDRIQRPAMNFTMNILTATMIDDVPTPRGFVDSSGPLSLAMGRSPLSE